MVVHHNTSQAEMLAGIEGFIIGGAIGMAAVAVHRSACLVRNAMEGYQGVPRSADTVVTFDNQTYETV